jgi:hypothetical protein
MEGSTRRPQPFLFRSGVDYASKQARELEYRAHLYPRVLCLPCANRITLVQISLRTLDFPPRLLV